MLMLQRPSSLAQDDQRRGTHDAPSSLPIIVAGFNNRLTVRLKSLENRKFGRCWLVQQRTLRSLQVP